MTKVPPVPVKKAVPKAVARRKAIWKKVVLERLRVVPIISDAAKAANISSTAIWNERKKNPKFSQEFDDAMQEGFDFVEREIYRRAVLGVDHNIYYQGRIVGREKKYSDYLLLRLAMANRPEKWGNQQRLEHAGEIGRKGEVVIVELPDNGRDMINVTPGQS